LTALKKIIQSHPETVAGIELELDGINPGRKWAEAQNSYKKKVRQRPPMQSTNEISRGSGGHEPGRCGPRGAAPAGNYWLKHAGFGGGRW